MEKKCDGKSRIRSKGMGRGLGKGMGSGAFDVPCRAGKGNRNGAVVNTGKSSLGFSKVM